MACPRHEELLVEEVRRLKCVNKKSMMDLTYVMAIVMGNGLWLEESQRTAGELSQAVCVLSAGGG